MRKQILAILLVAVLILAGCGKTTPPEESLPEAEQVHEQVQTPSEADLFLEKYVNTDARPIAVMVDNDDNNARPQAGLEDAFLLYEIVVEGGATRFMALYRNTDTAKIGPVRSSRHYFLNYVLENDAIYTHYGWSPKAMADIGTLGVKNINGTEGGGDIFWRERKFAGDWHSAYTSIENITDKAKKWGYNLTTKHKNGLIYGDEHSEPQADLTAQKVILRYSSAYRTAYTYNPATKLYEKSIFDRPHTMQSGEVLSFKNVLVLYVPDGPLGDGSDRREVYTTGSGKGYYISDGAAEEITWSKSSRGADTILTKADGTSLKIYPGKTIINYISPNIGANIE